MNKILKILLIALFFLIVIYLFRGSFGKIEDVTVRLKWRHQAQFAGMYVADQKGYYKHSGLNVDLREMDFNLSQIDELLSGEVDFIVVSPAEFLSFVDQSKPIKAIAAIYQVSPYIMVSLSESGIKTPADFWGKKIANKGGKLESSIFIDLLLHKYGLSESDVERVDIDFSSHELDDLLTHRADVVGVYRTDQTYYFDQADVSYDILKPELFGITINNDLIVTTNNLVENNPELIENFIDATVKGWEYALNNEDDAVDITMRYVDDESYMDKNLQKYILENSKKLIKESTAQKIGEIDIKTIRDLYNTMMEQNMLKNNVDFRDFMTNRFIQ